MQFAASVAGGKSLVSAYREVYQPTNGKAPSVYQNAKRSAKHPAIAARIRELQVELLPAPEDMRAVYQHGLAVILQLSITSEDSRVRLRALDEILAELHDLYRRAPTQEPLEMVSHEEEPCGQGGEVLEPPDESSVVEAQWNREGVEEAATTANVLLPARCTKEASEATDLEVLEPSTVEDATETLVSPAPAPEMQYDLVPIPGYFPPRFRRVQRRG
jgi:hypothetical protein